MSSTSDFTCSICLDTASEPVVTRCGHLFCWGCLGHWLRTPTGGPECPVCKGRVDESMPGDIIPLYGKGRRSEGDSRPVPAPTAPSPSASDSLRAVDGSEMIGTGPRVTPTGERDTSYSYRFVRRGASEEAGARGSAGDRSAPHPRPTAPRAPSPRPRRGGGDAPAPHAGHGAQHRALPLSLGGSFIFLGGNATLTVLFIAMWAAYQFLPWQEWKREVEHRLARARQHGARAFFVAEPAAEQAPGEDLRSGSEGSTRSNSTPAGAAPQLTPADAVLRYAAVGVTAFVVLANLLMLV